MENFIDSLSWRGMVYNYIPGLEKLLYQETTRGYIGFDPTAPSLHLGNLATIMLLKHFQQAGHQPIILVGGATASIGDPSGKNKERSLLSQEVIQYNVENITRQLKNFLDFTHPTIGAKIYNNYDWFKDFNYLQFLRQVGKNISVSYLIHKETIKNRLATGISYTEFSYPLLQAYDFYYLYKYHNVKLQMGGSDQWGNLTTGVELVRKTIQKAVFALTTPLVTKSDGTKFGKTEQGAIWLDHKKTSPYQMYQFILNITDKEAIQYVKIFTLLSKQDISMLIEKHQKNPSLRILQKKIAKAIMDMVYQNSEEYSIAEKISDVLFGDVVCEVLNTIAKDRLESIVNTIPHVTITKSSLEDDISIVDLLTSLTHKKIFTSKNEVFRFIKDGGLYINKKRIVDHQHMLVLHKELISERYLLIQKGKKKHYFLIFNA